MFSFWSANNAGIQSVSSASSSVALVNPAWVPVAAITAPNLLNWNSVSGKIYQVWSTTNLLVPFTAYGGMVTSTTTSITFTNPATDAARYYKIKFFP